MGKHNDLWDYLLELAEKSCPETVARQGNLELWEANRSFVIAGIRFVKVLAREASSGRHGYKDLTETAINVYHGILESERMLVEEMLSSESEWEKTMAVGQEVVATMKPSIDALLDFDEIDQAHQAARNNTPKWKQD